MNALTANQMIMLLEINVEGKSNFQVGKNQMERNIERLISLGFIERTKSDYKTTDRGVLVIDYFKECSLILISINK